MKPYTWKCADGRVINHKDLGDKHLVNILMMIERTLRLHGSTPVGILNDTSTLPANSPQLEHYDRLVLEAVRRGLFDWSADRKQLSSTSTLITARRKKDKTTVRQLATPPRMKVHSVEYMAGAHPHRYRQAFIEDRPVVLQVPASARITQIDRTSDGKTTYTLVDD
jgi:hypothetical protein